MADLWKQDESIAFFCPCTLFAVLMALCSVALAELRAAASPDLNAAFLCFRRARTSDHNHGFGFPQMVMAFVTPTSFVYVPQKQSVYSSTSVIDGVAESLKTDQSMHSKQF